MRTDREEKRRRGGRSHAIGRHEKKKFKWGGKKGSTEIRTKKDWLENRERRKTARIGELAVEGGMGGTRALVFANGGKECPGRNGLG